MTIIDSDNEWSERIVIKKNQFSSAIVICLKLVFIEMLDKLITYIHTYIHSVLVQDFITGLACHMNLPYHYSSLS